MDLVEKIKILKNHFNVKNYKRVIEGSTKLLKKIPQNDYLLNLTGMAYQGLSQHKNAIKYFSEALRCAPNNVAAMNNFANTLKAVGKLEQSRDLYEKILKINPNYINAYNNYANLKTLINDYSGAIILYKKALDLISKSKTAPKTTKVNFLFSLAVAFQSENKIEETKKTVDEIFSIDPSHVGAHKLISSLLKYSKENDESLDHIKKMESIYKQTNQSDYEKKVDLSYALGKAYEDIKDFGTAYHFYEKANELKFDKFGSNIEAEKKAIDNIIKIFSGIDLAKSNQEIQN